LRHLKKVNGEAVAKKSRKQSKNSDISKKKQKLDPVSAVKSNKTELDIEISSAEKDFH